VTREIVLWKWAKPTRLFETLKNPYWTSAGLRFKSHNKVVYAGLNPVDWMETMGKGATLHKIILTKQQAELCVVAEACFRPTDEELGKFIEKKQLPLIGGARNYTYEHYEESFIPLLEYSDGYNLPEVLIPFSVKAEIVSCAKMMCLIWKLRMRIEKKMGLGRINLPPLAVLFLSLTLVVLRALACP